jgi:hypothetical protein
MSHVDIDAGIGVQHERVPVAREALGRAQELVDMKSPIEGDQSTDRLSWYVEALHVGDLSILALLTPHERCL